MNFKFLKAAFAGAILVSSNLANAGIILYAQDHASGDTSIANVLSNDGHNVTSLVGGFSSGVNSDLTSNLSGYDAIFWSASGEGSGNVHNENQFTALLSYVFNGGNVFVTGYDSIASPFDSWLVSFVGGSGSVDLPGTDLTQLVGSNSLTTGLFDIENITPTGAYSDRDGLTGLTAGTNCLSTSTGGSCQWALRTYGAGEIAYVSAGVSGSGVDPALSTNGNVYNSGLRNFAYNANMSQIPEPSTLAIFALGIIGLASRRFKKKS